MNLETIDVRSHGVRFALRDESGAEVARAYLYLGWNDLHPEQPFGLLEDVFVAGKHRGKGVGSELARRVIVEARARGCYKLIATSRLERPEVHQLYLRLGFQEWGKEFRMDFSVSATEDRGV